MRVQEEQVINNIEKYLIDNSLKKNVLSKATGLREYTVTSILTKRRKISIPEYIDICNYFKLPFEYFLMDKKEGTVNPTTNSAPSPTKYD